MDTQLAIKATQLQNWALIIKDCKESGLKVTEYCDQHGITKHAYYYWFNKVKRSVYSNTAFVEITPSEDSISTCNTISDTPSDTSTETIEIRNGSLTVSVPLTVSREKLLMLLEVISHAQ